MDGELALHLVLIGVWDDAPLRLLARKQWIQVGVGLEHYQQEKFEY
jgi:hypothetical protein